MKFQLHIILLILSTPFLFNGCSTPGSITEDREELSAQMSSVNREESLNVILIDLPGYTGASISIAPGISGSGSVNADKIALEEARFVFSKAFPNFEVRVKGLDEMHALEADFRLEISANARTSSMNGKHDAILESRLFDKEGKLLLESSDKGTIDDWQYAQHDSMQRAFVVAYTQLLNKILALPEFQADNNVLSDRKSNFRSLLSKANVPAEFGP